MPEVIDRTQILRMPNEWLNPQEREEMRNSLFSQRDLNQLGEIRYFNRQCLDRAEAIVMFLLTPAGFLGDAVQNSRLAGLLNERYPERVFVDTNHPDLFGKYRLADAPRKPLNGRFEVVYREADSRAPRIVRINNYFLVNGSTGGLLSGRFFTPNLRMREAHSSLPDTQDLDDVENIHILHAAQIIWELLYGGNIDALPESAIKINPQAQERAQEAFGTLPVNDGVNFVLHPDASNYQDGLLFLGKQWPTEKWIRLANDLTSKYPNSSVFVSRGADHPEVSQRILQGTSQNRNIYALPGLTLPEYAGVIDCFPKDKTVFIGLDSMPAGHLAPSLGLKSIVLGDLKLYPRHYGPWGGLVVANGDLNPTVHTKGVSVEKMLEAVEIIQHNTL